MAYLQALVGLLSFIGIAYLFSENKKHIPWRLVIVGVLMQIIFGILITKVEFVAYLFTLTSKAFVTFLDFSLDGARFLFGDLALNSFNFPQAKHNLGFIFAFQVLPTIIFFSTVSSGLYYLGVLQKIVYIIAWSISKFMKLSGAESLAAAGNIFLGQTEAPLLVRPFITRMTKSELMCMMTGGMATIAGGVLAAYVSFLGGENTEQRTLFASYLLSASIMSAPAAILMAKIIVPETEEDKIDTTLRVNKEQLGVNLIDAMTKGATDGVKLAVNVGGMLLAFIAVIAFLNFTLGKIGAWTSLNELVVYSTNGQFEKFSLEYVLGQVGRPIAFLMGVEWKDCLIVGSLLGQKTALNEFIAYTDLARFKELGRLQPKSIVIATYALCGFSNFSSIAIQVGAIGSLAPTQQGNLSKLGFKALLASSLACLMTGCIAGILH